MTKIAFGSVLVGLVFGLCTRPVDASAVTSLVVGQGDSAHVASDDNGTTATGSRVINPDTGGTVGTASWDATALAKHRPFSVAVGLFGTTGFHDSETQIDFTITLTNMAGAALADPNQDAAIGDDIGPIDLSITDPSGGSFTFTSGAIPFGVVGGVTYLGTRISDTLIRIGGLNGGGFQIPWGTSGTLNFSVDVPASVSGGFNLTTTANPEPASLALATLGACLFGGGGYLRRRKRIQKDNAPSVDNLPA